MSAIPSNICFELGNQPIEISLKLHPQLFILQVKKRHIFETWMYLSNDPVHIIIPRRKELNVYSMSFV